MTDLAATTRIVDGVEVPPVGTYQIDAAHTVVGFVVRHVMVSKVRGHFNNFEGTVVIGENPTDSSVTATVQMDSIDTREEKRDEHLRSSDFFEVANFPQMTLKSTGVHFGKKDATLDGDLTIKGVTKPVTFNLEYNGAAQDPWGGERIGFSAWTEIDRSEFGLTYNAALEAGGIMIGTNVRIELEVEALKSA